MIGKKVGSGQDVGGQSDQDFQMDGKGSQGGGEGDEFVLQISVVEAEPVDEEGDGSAVPDQEHREDLADGSVGHGAHAVAFVEDFRPQPLRYLLRQALQQCGRVCCRHSRWE